MSTKSLEKELNALFELCQKIHEVKQTRSVLNMNSNKTNPVIVSLNKYIKVFQRTDAQEHVPFLNSVYNKFKKEILKNENDKWIRNNSVVIQYGDNISDANAFNAVKSMRVHLSIFYNDSIKICDEVEKDLEGLPEETRASRNELLYPEFFMLHWYRICRSLADNKQDRDTLSRHVKKIESELGIQHDEQPDQTPSASDPLSSMLMNFTKSLQGMKMPQLPQNLQDKPVNAEDLGKIVNNVLSNPTINKTINSLVSDMSGGSIDQVLGKMISKLSDPTLAEAISSTITSTAESASESSKLIEGPSSSQ